MSRVRMSDGIFIEKSTLDYRVSKAKEKKLAEQVEEHGYNFCETCIRNDCKPIDVAHIKSVDWCQKNGMAELAWDLENMIVEGRNCHKKRDKLYLFN